MPKIFTKMQDFLNEEVATKLDDVRKNLFTILKNANDKINKENLSLVKDDKKLKLTTSIVDGNREPRYKKSETMPSSTASASTTATSAGTTSKSATPTSPSVGNLNPIYFVFNTADSKDPIANFKFVVAGKNDIVMTEKDVAAVHYNKMNMMYIPDEMQNRIEKKIGKIEKS